MLYRLATRISSHCCIFVVITRERATKNYCNPGKVRVCSDVEMTTHESSINSFLSNDDEDSRAIEDAITAAIKAVMYVLCNINNNKIRAYEMMVAQRDRENERLRMQMKSAEMELVSLRRLRRTAGPPPGFPVDSTYSLDSGISSEENSKHDVCPKLLGSCDVEEDTRGPVVRSKEFSIECTGPCAGAAEQANSDGWGTMVDPSLGKAFHCGSRDWTSCGSPNSDGDGGRTAGAAADDPSPVKEEPSDFKTVCVKWEVCDRVAPEGAGAHPAPKSSAPSPWSRGGPSPRGGAPNHSFGFTGPPGERSRLPAPCQKSARLVWPDLEMKRMSNREKLQRYRARIRADPDKYQVYREMDRRRYQMRKKSIKDLPEHCQKLKREAWREAARRHRARKKSCPPIGPDADLTLNVEVPLDPSEILQSWDPTVCTSQGNQVLLD